MENIGIETTQNVDIQYKIATIGDRVLAEIIDLLILFGYAFGMMFLLIYLSTYFYNSPYYYPTAFFIITYLPFFLYDLLCEIFLNGQSFGKKLLKIKVVKVDGSQPGIGNYFLRWILKPIDVYFVYGSIGIITMLINGRGQRLGDLAANTTVIKLKQDVKLEDILLPKVDSAYNIVYPQVSLLNDGDIQLIKEVLNRRIHVDDYTYHNLLEKTKVGIAKKMGIEPDPNPTRFLNLIIKDYTHLNSN